jgi:hypothetical protein
MLVKTTNDVREKTGAPLGLWYRTDGEDHVTEENVVRHLISCKHRYANLKFKVNE